MSAANRVLVLGALVLGLSPAIASACDEDDAKKAAAARATTITVTATSKDTKSCTVTATVKACAEAGAPKAQGAAASKQRRPGWSPGHLIEPDSMRLAPQQQPEDPGAEWVIISSRHGAWHVRRHSGKRNT